MSLFAELRRRSVFRVAAAYAIVAWLLIQIAVAVFPTLQLPPWTATLVTVLLIIGFPVALVLAWAYELTPDGIKPARPAVPAEAASGTKVVDYVLIAGLVLVAGVMLVSQFRGGEAAAPPTADSGRPSIAVLPFEDMSPAGDQEYFGDGIADQLLNELTLLDGIDVASRTSAFAYKGSTENVQAIGRALGVKTVLEGGIRKDGDQLRVTAQLIDTETGFHIMSRTYTRELTDVFDLQEELASTVAGQLGVQFGLGGTNAFRGAGTNNVEAYDAFLRSYAISDFGERERALERVVELDPNYSAAWAQLGLASVSRVWLVPPPQMPGVVEEARQYVARAIELDPDSAEAHAQYGTILYARNDWIEGQEEHDLAMSLRRDYEMMLQNMLLMLRAGRMTASLGLWEAAETGISLPPPRSVEGIRIAPFIALGEFEQARTMLSGLDSSETPDLKVLLALSEGSAENVRSALAGILLPRVAVTQLYRPVLERFDDRAAVIELLHTVYENGVEWPSKWHDISRLAAWFGDTEFALELAAAEARFGSPRRHTLWMPFMAEARRLPGFKQLVIDIGLVDYWRRYGWSDFCQPVGETDFTCS